jgi:hypothetical protein
MTEIDTIPNLLKQIADGENREVILFAEREAISFDAVVERQKSAIKRLEEINSELAALRDSNATLNAALREARRRETAAAAEKSAEAARDRAAEAEPIGKRLAERGATIDAAIKTCIENIQGMREDLEVLARLGMPVPSRDLVRVNLNRAWDTMTASLDKTRPMSPVQRTGYDRLAKAWSAPVLTLISTRTNTNNAAADAA